MRISRSLGWSIVAAFALVALAVVATAWTTRGSVVDASDEVRRGQALAAEQAVRAELADLGGPPSDEDLAAILHDHSDEGVRYLAMVGGRGRVSASAGTPVGGEPGADRVGRKMFLIGGRMRIESRTQFRRAWGEGGRALGMVMEVEPVQADAMRAAATRTLGIGALAALGLLGVAVVLVRRELRRQADDSARERERRSRASARCPRCSRTRSRTRSRRSRATRSCSRRCCPRARRPRRRRSGWSTRRCASSS